MPLEPGDDPVPCPCVANLDSVERVFAAVLVGRLRCLGDVRMNELCRALAVAVACE